MTDYEVEQRLGYTPCVCAKIDGTWHPRCYAGKTREQLAAGYKRAFAAARRHLKAQAAPDSKTPNVAIEAGPTARDDMTEANETGRPLGLASTAGLGARVAQVREQLVSVDVQRYFARLHTEDSARIAMLEAELRKVWPGTQDDLRARLDWVRMLSLSRESLQKLGLEAPNTGAEL